MRKFMFLTLMCFSIAASAEVIFVSKAGNGADGASWETAYRTISDAIEAATSGDEIWVASGSYNELLNIRLSGLSLFGGFEGNETEDEFSLRDWKAHETIVDATSLPRNAISILDANEVVMDGFTIQNARVEGDAGGYGGGIQIGWSQVIVSNCRIESNFVGIHSDGWYLSGGGVALADSVVRISGCCFIDNYAASSGGAIVSLDVSLPYDTRLYLSNCLFDENVGTAVRTIDTQVHLEYCTFGSQSRWPHNSFFDLDTFPSSGPRGATVTNCIITDKIRPFTNATYSNIRDYPGKGNIDEDPRFISSEGGDFRLRPDSPCIDSGTDVEVFHDLDGNPRPVDVKGRGIGRGFDMGCYEFQLKKSDLNEDGYVNAEDLILFREHWHEETSQ